MGGKQSTNNNSSRVQSGSSGSQMASTSGTNSLGVLSLRQRNGGSGISSSSESRQRARSLSNVLNGHSGQPISIPPNHGAFELSGSPESDTSIPVEIPIGRVYAAHSLPVQLVSFHGIKCPVCSKFVPPDDVECHLVMCLTKPRIVYNGTRGSSDNDSWEQCLGLCTPCREQSLLFVITGKTKRSPYFLLLRKAMRKVQSDRDLID